MLLEVRREADRDGRALGTWIHSFSVVTWKCKSKLEWDITSYPSEQPSSESLQTINTREGMERREPSYTVGRNVNWYNHYGEQFGGSLKN